MFSKLFTTVKFSLVAVNFLFVITGIILLSVGMYVRSAYDEYYVFLSDSFFDLPSFCIAVGIFIFLIAAFGFFGAFMENTKVCKAFAGAMIAMSIFQLIGCITGFHLRRNAVSMIYQQLSATMDLYGTGVGKNLELTVAWDAVQRDFSCCGVINATDWLIPLNTTINQGLPMSCCPPVPGTVHTRDCIVGVGAYQIGCTDAFGDYIGSLAGSVAVAGVFLVLMQVFIAAISGWLVRRSKFEEVELNNKF